jgi:hypothetical protein
LENGRTREELVDELTRLADAHDGDLVAGLDFSFSLPDWFVTSFGCNDAPSFWEVVADQGETWLRECAPPFWGRPGCGRPPGIELYRATERALIPRPKSTFQIGGAGTVGTGSIRGMPLLTRLRERGFAIWPFDDGSRRPLIVEAWPRLFSNANRSDRDALEPYPTADAFDAAQIALALAAHPLTLGPSPFPVTEGAIFTR